jgi:hypothetical protein
MSADYDIDRWRRDHPLAAAALLVGAGAGSAVLLAPWVDADVARLLYGAAVALVFTAFLGGLVKLLMDDAAAVRKRQENAAEFVVNVLADLKDVYDRVGRARIVIPAHRSAKTYGEEMRDIIDARVKLLNVIRAVTQRADGVSPAVLRHVAARAGEMEGYLAEITSEFKENYKRVSDLQAAYEAARKPDGGTPPGPWRADQPSPDPWAALQLLPRLAELVDGGARWRGSFVTPLERATGALRAELATILGSRPRHALPDEPHAAPAEPARAAAS